jgi:hypothetical protein
LRRLVFPTVFPLEAFARNSFFGGAFFLDVSRAARFLGSFFLDFILVAIRAVYQCELAVGTSKSVNATLFTRDGVVHDRLAIWNVYLYAKDRNELHEQHA